MANRNSFIVNQTQLNQLINARGANVGDGVASAVHLRFVDIFNYYVNHPEAPFMTVGTQEPSYIVIPIVRTRAEAYLATHDIPAMRRKGIIDSAVYIVSYAIDMALKTNDRVTLRPDDINTAFNTVWNFLSNVKYASPPVPKVRARPKGAVVSSSSDPHQ